MRIIVLTMGLGLLLCPAGCVPQEQQEEQVRDSRVPEVMTLRQDNARLKRENKNLKTENTVLKSRAEELAEREKRLSKKMTRMRFELVQLRKQVKLLVDLPRERDYYKAEARKTKLQLIKLESELRELRLKLQQARQTQPAPSTLPGR